ncbi:hypothetical protein M885DRAFT_610457 [Pelagophyceae sp. CCMP2097]|nr:hypothetical protein M885DRAFT_610457 [Pelagophyceae sp. CCMP2097]
MRRRWPLLLLSRLPYANGRRRMAQWGAANAKVRDGSAPKTLASLLHAMWGLDHYPRYLQRWRVDEIEDLEKTLEDTLLKVRAAKAERSKAQMPPHATLGDAAKVKVGHVLEEGLIEALGWAADESIADALAKPPTSRDSPWFNMLSEEPCDGVYTFRALKAEFCETLLEAVDRTSCQGMAKNAPRANLDVLGLGWIADVLLAITEGVSKRVFPRETCEASGVRAALDWRHAYVLQYTPKTEAQPDARASLVSHTDDSEITLNVALGRSFDGGSLLLGGVRGTTEERRDPALNAATTPVGSALVHVGRHLHAVAPVLTGERRVLICWTRSLAGTRSRVCPCCYMNRRADAQSGDCICGPAWNG